MANQFYTLLKVKTLCSVVGVEAQKYGQHMEFAIQLTYIKRILSSRIYAFSQNGFTEEQLRSVGINNVINTGCPTM